MATSVEEWLAEGNKITRDDDTIVEQSGHRWKRDRETTAEWKCVDCGAYGHKRSNVTMAVRAFVCVEHGCKEDGKHQANAVFWCDEHRNSPRNTR